jgi:YihY family inner membrane protein
VDEQRLLDAIAANLELLVPGQASAITAHVKSFVIHRTVVGIVGVAVLVFFSSMAFTVLENAMAMIFYHRGVRRRHFLVSAIIPYLFMMSLGLGLLLVTMISAALDVVGHRSVQVLGRAWSLAGLPAALLHLLGVLGLVMILTALYMVLPGGHVAFRRALVGAVTATVLWEVVRRLLVLYFAKLSMVNLVYGPFASTIVVLLTLEMAAMILLLGAQLVAEVERA